MGELPGVQCQHDTATGRQCDNRVYAGVYLSHPGLPAGCPPRVEYWYCGAHQSSLRKQGFRLELARKWEAAPEVGQSPDDETLEHWADCPWRVGRCICGFDEDGGR